MSSYSTPPESAPDSPLAGSSSPARPGSSHYRTVSLSDSPDIPQAPFTPPTSQSPPPVARRTPSGHGHGHGRQQSSLGSGTHLLRSLAQQAPLGDGRDGGDLGGWTLEDAEQRRRENKGKGRGAGQGEAIGEERSSDEESEVDSEAERARIAAVSSHILAWHLNATARR